MKTKHVKTSNDIKIKFFEQEEQDNNEYRCYFCNEIKSNKWTKSSKMYIFEIYPSTSSLNGLLEDGFCCAECFEEFK